MGPHRGIQTHAFVLNKDKISAKLQNMMDFELVTHIRYLLGILANIFWVFSFAQTNFAFPFSSLPVELYKSQSSAPSHLYLRRSSRVKKSIKSWKYLLLVPNSRLNVVNR